MKILLALSAAIITGLLLFLPGSRPSQSHTTHLIKRNDSYDTLPVVDSAHEPLQKANLITGQSSKMSKEILIRAQKRSQEVQAQLKSMLDSEPHHLMEARKLLRARQRELLLDKTLVLGEELFAGTATAETGEKTVVQALDKELSVVSAQLDLLAKTDLKD